MKKKVLATVVTLALSAMVFAGCGSSQESATAASYEESTGPAVYADEVGEEPAEIAEPDDASRELIDVTGENDDFGRPPEDECAEWEEDDGIEEEVVIAETGEIEGIIVVQNYFYHADDGISNIFVYSIESINPTTGESAKIAEFSINRPHNVTSSEFYYLTPIIGLNNRFGYDRRFFSNDFSKMAATKVFNDKNETHAGWIDQSGEFFDVTEALGEQSSDFGDPVTYGAIGFTEDNLFVYSNNPSPSYMYWHNDDFRYVSPDSNKSQEGNPLEGLCQIIDGNNRFYCISDRIDEGTFLVDGYEGDFCGSMLYNPKSHESSEYIPGTSRSNWSGVCSPDGSQIAFLSMPKEGNGNPEIFIIPFEGGEPEKLNCDIVFSNDTDTSPSSILEWK